MSMKDELVKIVGKENVSDAGDALLQFAQDLSLLPAGMANIVVQPESSEQVSAVVKLANENNVPVVPVSSKVHFHGSTIPKQGGIVMDLGKMNKIIEIDVFDRRIRIEPGVTWGQLVPELDKKEMRMVMPLCPHKDRSVLTDYLEREVPTNTVYEYNEPLQSFEVVWPNGDIFRGGSASVPGYPQSKSHGSNPSGPGLDFYRLVQGAQGTMGALTWSNIKIEHKPQIDKVLFAPITDLARGQEFLYRILPRRIGEEVLLLNNVDLATILADKWPDDFETLRKTLPPWTLVVVICGLMRRPEEKIAYEEKFLNQVMKNEFKDIALTDNLPGFPGIGKKLLPLLRNPWPKEVYWKNQWKGASQSLFFICKPKDTLAYVNTLRAVAVKYGYKPEDIGMYVQPIEHNRACQMEFTFFYNPEDASEKANIANLYKEAAAALISEGAYFTRPYGVLAPMMYERAGSYTSLLKRVKKIFDPNNIMNPGNLCF
ncbi:MAG: FAD-binding oxidoreductase [Desulfotomaculaceae bacterium]|nr:FAD-binding oxidoreductase [Desulfotomaculaceae bacterium]